MYEKLSEHDERILELETAKDAHLKEILALKKNDEKQDKEILELKNSYVNLENTIMKENRETRQAYQTQTDRLWDFIEQTTGFKENESKRKHDFKMHRTSQVTGIILKIVTGGGITYLLIQDWLLTR